MATSVESEVTRTTDKGKGKFRGMIISFVLGLGSLCVLNSIWTVGDYYYIVFPKYHPMRVFTIVYQPFALVTTVILAHYESKIETRIRNLSGYTLFFACCLLIIILDVSTAGKGGIGTYIGLCSIVAFLGIAHALVQGGVTGDLSFMCPEFIQSFVGGVTAAGVIASILRLITKAYFEKYDNGLRKGALLSFGIAAFLEVLCIILYTICFPNLPIVKYYHSKAASEGSKTLSVGFAVELNEVGFVGNPPERLSKKQLFVENIDYAADLFLIYVLTLFIMPGFLYEDTGLHQLGTWYPLVLITMYNIMDLISSYVPLIKCLKLESRKWLLVATLSRFLMVPAFYFTAKYGHQGWMIFLVSFLGLSNGYLTVCVYTLVPKGYKGPEQNALGNLLALWLLSGIFVGVALDWLWLIGKSGSF